MPTRLHGDRRSCPVNGCRGTVRAGHLMCAPHWRQVPKDLQLQVWSTWRSWQRTMTDDDWTAYLTARAAALTYLEEHRA